jgi:hypothetical protein
LREFSSPAKLEIGREAMATEQQRAVPPVAGAAVAMPPPAPVAEVCRTVLVIGALMGLLKGAVNSSSGLTKET